MGKTDVDRQMGERGEEEREGKRKREPTFITLILTDFMPSRFYKFSYVEDI